MKLAIMQPYFFPYIGYWQLINAVDKFVIYDDVNFIKKGWINRNNILENSDRKMINLHLKKASQNKLIKDIKVLNEKVYNLKFLKTIKHTYQGAPYFNNTYTLIETIMNYNESNLALYLENLTREVCKFLSIKTDFIRSSDLNKDNNLRGQNKILAICDLLKADEYYNSIGGEKLYSYEEFMKKNISLKFLKCKDDIVYKQFEKEFVPNLSIIDIMMFNSPEKINEMLEEYELL